MQLLDKYISLSRQGEAVWISDVREGFAALAWTKPMKLRLCCLDGGEREYLCPVPAWETQEQRSFILEYLKAGVFNVLSCYSGRSLHICLNMGDRELRELAEDCLASFRKEPGLKKVLNIAGRLRTIFKEGVTSFDVAQNIVVLKTMPGLASAACAAIDGMDIPSLVGSLAGDDTAILIMRTNEDASEFCNEIHAMLK